MIPWDEARRLLRKADQDRIVFYTIKNQQGFHEFQSGEGDGGHGIRTGHPNPSWVWLASSR